MTYLIPKKKPKKVKHKSISKLKKDADKIFSLWIRARDKRCVTCGSTKNLQNGHYISRSHSSTRYLEKNNNCQCLVCNIFMKGNYPAYTIYLMRKYGNGIIKELERKGRETKQFTPSELEKIIKKYS